jgi:RhtB (resistance to homoserine/threonine) family protein
VSDYGIHQLTLFIVSGLLLNIAPGPDSLLIMLRSAAQGARAGMLVALGIGAGTCVHILAAAFGLSALLTTSATAFTVVKLMGAAYLVYIGVGMLRARPAATLTQAAPPTPIPPGKIFLQGFLTNVLNPKVALFFLAFMPQFIDAAAPNKALAFLILGAIFNVNGVLWCLFLAWASAGASQRIKVSARVSAWLNRAIGAVFVGLGLKLALARA